MIKSGCTAEFNSTDLKNVFDVTNFTAADSTTSSATAPKPEKLSSASKVGIAVGTIAGAASIAGIFIYLRAHRRKHKDTEKMETIRRSNDNQAAMQEFQSTQVLELNATERAPELEGNTKSHAHESDSRQLPAELPAVPSKVSP